VRIEFISFGVNTNGVDYLPESIMAPELSSVDIENAEIG